MGFQARVVSQIWIFDSCRPGKELSVGACPVNIGKALLGRKPRFGRPWNRGRKEEKLLLFSFSPSPPKEKKKGPTGFDLAGMRHIPPCKVGAELGIYGCLFGERFAGMA